MPPRSPTGPPSNAAFERRDNDKARRTSVSSQQINQHHHPSSASAPHTAVAMGDVERAAGGSGSSSGGVSAQQQQQDEREALIDRKGSKGALRSTVQQGQVVRQGGHACWLQGGGQAVRQGSHAGCRAGGRRACGESWVGTRNLAGLLGGGRGEWECHAIIRRGEWWRGWGLLPACAGGSWREGLG